MRLGNTPRSIFWWRTLLDNRGLVLLFLGQFLGHPSRISVVYWTYGVNHLILGRLIGILGAKGISTWRHHAQSTVRLVTFSWHWQRNALQRFITVQRSITLLLHRVLIQRLLLLRSLLLLVGLFTAEGFHKQVVFFDFLLVCLRILGHFQIHRSYSTYHNRGQKLLNFSSKQKKADTYFAISSYCETIQNYSGQLWFPLSKQLQTFHFSSNVNKLLIRRPNLLPANFCS